MNIKEIKKHSHVNRVRVRERLIGKIERNIRMAASRGEFKVVVREAFFDKVAQDYFKKLGFKLSVDRSDSGGSWVSSVQKSANKSVEIRWSEG